MGFVLIGAAVCAALVGASAVLFRIDNNRLSWLWPVGLITACLAGTIAILTAIAPFAYTVDRSNCNGFEREAGIETRFVNYTPFTWDCLALVNGQWVPLDTIRADATNP